MPMHFIHGTDNGETLDYNDGVTSGDDTISALGRDDRVYAGDGNDTIYGGNGDDMIIGGGGADVIDGGNGNDTANYAHSSTAVFVSLTTGSGLGGEAQGDTLDGIENLV